MGRMDSRDALFHAGEFGVADDVFFEFWVEGALAAEPGEGAFGFLAEFDVRIFRGWRIEDSGLGGGFFDGDLDEFGAGADAYIHAAGDDEFGLGLWIGDEHFERGDKVFIGEFGGFAAEQAADVAARDAAGFGEVALVHRTAFDAALKGDGEVAHAIYDF